MTEQEKLTIRILRAYERKKIVGETFTCSDLIDIIPLSNHCVERPFTGAELMVAVRTGGISKIGEKEIDLDIPHIKRMEFKNGYIVIKGWKKAKVNIYKVNYTVDEYKMHLCAEIMSE